MTYLKDGEKFYIMEKSAKIIDDYIDESGNLLVKELREKRKINFKENEYV